jgi:hypothetical protein
MMKTSSLIKREYKSKGCALHKTLAYLTYSKFPFPFMFGEVKMTSHVVPEHDSTHAR